MESHKDQIRIVLEKLDEVADGGEVTPQCFGAALCHYVAMFALGQEDPDKAMEEFCRSLAMAFLHHKDRKKKENDPSLIG